MVAETTAITYVQRVPGGRFIHSLQLEPQGMQGTAGFDVSEIVERLVCQVLVSALPDRALQEACENLLDLHKYYSSVSQQGVLPQAAAVPFGARIGTIHVRPGIELEE